MFKGFQKPKRLVANTETLTERYGMFTAQPFERGFGSTIGTGLRRVLLSSIEGAAITSVRIEGVAHEFSPIPGVVEDATDIILNLKQVPFKMMGEGTRMATPEGRPAGTGDERADRDRRRRRSAGSQHAHRDRGRGRQAQHRNAPEIGARLCGCRPQLRRRSAARLHPHRLSPFAGAQSELHGGSRAPGPDDRLRQAHASKFGPTERSRRRMPSARRPSCSKTT